MTTSNPINISRIDHVVLQTSQLERMVDFYRDVLGCRLERGPGGIRLAQLRAGASLIDILEKKSLGPRGRKTRNMDHFCMLVTPWEENAITAHLRRHGIELGSVVKRYGALGIGPSLYIEDPDGNTVELKGPMDLPM